MSPYRPEILDELALHGICPKPATPPELVRSYLSDLYRYEIRRLREQLLAGKFPKREYSSRVAGLRSKYPLLALPIRFWMR